MQVAAKKIALVTGANKGIGFEVARQLAASGCTVLLGARNQVLGEEAADQLKRNDVRDVRYLAIDLEILPGRHGRTSDRCRFRSSRRARQQCRHRRARGRPAVV